MKIYLLFFIVVTFTCHLVGQKLVDYDYLFFTNNQLHDVRTLKPISTSFIWGEKVLSSDEETLTIHSKKNNSLIFYSTTDGSIISTVKLPYYSEVTFDHKWVFSIKDRDYFVREISSSGLGNESQLTNIGRIGNTSNLYIYKYNMFIAVPGDEKIYELSVNDSELKLVEDVNLLAMFEAEFSPSKRYVISNYKGSQPYHYFIDRETGMKTKLFDGFYNFQTYWLDEDSAFLMFGVPDPERPRNEMFGGFVYNFKNKRRLADFPPSLEGAIASSPLTYDPALGRAAGGSPDGRYFLMIHQNRNEKPDLLLYDTYESTVEKLLKGESRFPYFEFSFNAFFLRWIDEDTFVYGSEGSSLVDKGTFIYRISDKTITKIASEVAHDIWVFKNGEYIMFRSSNKLIYTYDNKNKSLLKSTGRLYSRGAVEKFNQYDKFAKLK
jgi:hypothetical protein